MNKSEQLIACLEGEIAKRDAIIYDERIDADLQRQELDAANSNLAGLRTELAAIKAQEPVAWISKDGTYAEASTKSTVYGSHTLPLYAAPVPVENAQVVMPERWNVPRPMWKDARQPFGNPLNHADIEAAEKFNLALDEVARLNAIEYAAPVSEAKAQPVSAAYCSVTCIESVKVGQLRYEEGRTYDVKGHSPAGVDVYADDAGSFSTFNNPAFNKHFNVATYRTAPVSARAEAKAQGVVQWPDADEIMQMAFEEGQPADDASGYCFELEEFDLFIERLMSEVASLNATPVQQASVPDVSAMARILADRNADACNVNREDNWAIYGQDYIDDVAAMLAAPAAPAADASHVFYGMDGNHP